MMRWHRLTNKLSLPRLGREFTRLQFSSIFMLSSLQKSIRSGSITRANSGSKQVQIQRKEFLGQRQILYGKGKASAL